MRRWASVITLAVMVGFGQPAHANDPVAAQDLYEDGQAAYSVANYLDAAFKFKSAYVKSPKPTFLWHAAQAFRKQYDIDGNTIHLRKARDLYENLVPLTTDDKMRADAVRELTAIEAILSAAEQPNATRPN